MPDGQTFCHGNGADHCCSFAGVVCPLLRDDGRQPHQGGKRRWVCTLYEELEDWDLVHDDPRYLATVQPLWLGSGWVMEWLWDEGVRCGNWPDAVRGVKRPRGNDPMRAEKNARIDQAIAHYQRLQADPEAIHPDWSCYGRRPDNGENQGIPWPSLAGD